MGLGFFCAEKVAGREPRFDDRPQAGVSERNRAAALGAETPATGEPESAEKVAGREPRFDDCPQAGVSERNRAAALGAD